MAFQANIKLTGQYGADSGPCDIYQNGDLYTTPVATGITMSQLTSPLGVNVGCNPSTTALKIQNTGTCSNFVNVPITFS